MQRIFNAANLTEANVILSILVEKGIHPQPLRTLPKISPAGVEMLYGVEVPVEQVSAANAVLQLYGYSSTSLAAR